MSRIDRRSVLNLFAASGATTLAHNAHAHASGQAGHKAGAPASAPPQPAQAPQHAPPPAPPQPQQPQQQQQPSFGFDDVLKRARDLAGAPYDALPPKLPDALGRLDFDAYRDIRFKAEKSPLPPNSGSFRLQLFHPGFIYTRPVVVNTIRDGIATPVPYSANLFDYGRNRFDHNLPVNLGFAGFRLHYPLNSPRESDEVVSFLGATYFRFLGRNQSYGLSARGLSVNTGGDDEEFPLFREFWIDVSDQIPAKASIYALLDSASVTGAFRFDLYPGVESVMEVSAAIIPRRPDVKFGLAPLTSMFFLGEDSPRPPGEFRPELHDSDGLLMHTGAGEWIWRNLRAPRVGAMSTFENNSIRGFGLVQRDRDFANFQDLELAYESRPTYFVEPHGDWGEGRVELLELATKDETADNIVAYWTPNTRPEANKPFYFSCRIRSLLDAPDLSPNGRVKNVWKTWPKALGSSEQVDVAARRFIVDFAGGDLGYFAKDPGQVEVNAAISSGKILRTFIAPNPHIDGFRAMIDAQTDPGVTVAIRAFLHAGPRALTETALIPWIAE